MGGCKRFRHERHDKVYVVGRKMVLHDRVAAVSSRVADVTNGQELEVLEHTHRFYKVKTQKNEIGWIEERMVIDGSTYQGFADLNDKHRNDPTISTATLRDDVYLHLTPGRNTDRFYLLAGNSKVQLLTRASVPKVAANAPLNPKPKAPTPSANPAAAAQNQKPADAQKNAQAKPNQPNAKDSAANKPVSASSASASKDKPAEPQAATAAEAPVPEAPVLEDWWLVRDGQGHTGWLLGNRLDVDVPDEITLLAEGQRVISAFVLNKVIDPDAQTPNHEVPQFLTLLSTLKSGLPYDYDQVRVFTWSLKRHRYETAFRLKPIEGFLPTKIYTVNTPKGNVPGFSITLDNAQASWIDAQTGQPRAKQPRTLGFALVDTQVKRTGPDLGPLPVTHQDDSTKNGKKDDKNKNKSGAAKKK